MAYFRLFLLLIAMMLCGFAASLYIDAEHFFYPWDEFTYFASVKKYYTQIHNGEYRYFLSGLFRSPSTFFAIPHLLAMILLGASRKTYVIVNAALYLPLIGLSCSMLARRMAQRWGVIDDILLFITVLTTPVLWKVTFEGFPDVGGLVIIALAFGVYFSAMDLPVDKAQKYTNQTKIFRAYCFKMFVYGFMLGTAAAFRRHYAYVIFAILLCTALHNFWQTWQKPFRTYKLFITHYLTPWVLCGLGSLVALLLLGKNVLGLIFKNPVGNNFSAWRTTPETVIHSWKIDFGIGIFFIFLVCTALTIYGLRTALFLRQRTKFFLLLGSAAVWATMWLSIVQFASAHYSVLFFPVLLAVTLPLGISCLTGPTKYIAVLLCLLCLGTITGATFLPAVRNILPSPVNSLAPEPFFPRTRADYADVVAMTEDLRKRARNTAESVYFASSSGLYNVTTLVQAEQALPPQPSVMQGTKDVDSIHGIPLADLISGEFLLIPHPAQYHMPPDRQRLIGMFTNFSESEMPLASCYTKETTYLLGSPPVSFTLYRKTRRLTDTKIITTGKYMLAFVDKPHMDMRSRFLSIGGNFKGVKLQTQTGAKPGQAFILSIVRDTATPIQGSLQVSSLKKQTLRYRHLAFTTKDEQQVQSAWHTLMAGKNKITPFSHAENASIIGYGIEFQWNNEESPPQITILTE